MYGKIEMRKEKDRKRKEIYLRLREVRQYVT